MCKKPCTPSLAHLRRRCGGGSQQTPTHIQANVQVRTRQVRSGKRRQRAHTRFHALTDDVPVVLTGGEFQARTSNGPKRYDTPRGRADWVGVLERQCDCHNGGGKQMVPCLSSRIQLLLSSCGQLTGLEVCSKANYKQTCFVSSPPWTASIFPCHLVSRSGRAVVFC